MLDGDHTTWWISNVHHGGWVEIASPKSQILKSVIITRRFDNTPRYKNVCLFVDGVSEVCTEDKYGNPLLSGEEITFSIEPRYVNKEQNLLSC